MSPILIVDDKEENLYYLEALLTGHGYTVELARHGAEALVKARQNPPQLIISDLLMPVMDGFTLLRHWKSDGRLKSIPLIVYTATYTEAEDERLALDLGADAFILKPAEPEEFLARVREVQANKTAGLPNPPKHQIGDEKALLKVYSESLIRKLEEKTLQLEQANQALQHDIVERRRTADSLRESEERFRATFEQAAVGLAHVGLDGKFLRINDKFCEITGYPREELLNLSLAELTVPEDRAAGLEGMATMLAGRQTTFTSEKRNLSRQGEIYWVNLVISLLHDENRAPKYFIAVFTNITERKNLEQQFLRVQRLDSMGALASGIAHDLNNVLAPIMLSIALIKLRLPAEDETLARQLDLLAKTTERGAKLVRHLLNFGRGLVSDRVVFQPRHVAHEIEQLVRETFPKNIEVHHSYDHDLWNITGDPTQLHQVLLNLCVNARDALPQGGRILIRLGNAIVDQAISSRHLDAKPGLYVALSVTDNGAGIPAAVREKIFDPFFTTKEPDKGTGLGLSSSLAIVRSHEGFIDLETEEGKGTTFKVYLPASKADTTTAPAPEASRHEGRNELILVVDDEPIILEVTKRILERYGYRVLLAENGVEAVSQYALQHDKIAAVITDMSMPIMGGPATILALRTINPNVRIIASSGKGLETSRKEAGAAGAEIADFIAKPFTSGDLLQCLRKVLGNHSRPPFTTNSAESSS